MSKESSLAASLNKLSEMSSSGEVARVKQRRSVKAQAWSSDDNASNLLGCILDDSSKDAEEEARQQEEARQRATEDARRRREYEEDMKRLEAERELTAQQQQQEELRLRQAEMQAQLQRQKDIEAGLIDLEEEARLAREEEARKRAEAEAKARKEAEKRANELLLREQQAEIEALRQQEILEQSRPKRSKVPFIAMAALVVLGLGGGIGYYLLSQEPVDIYALSTDYDSRSIGFLPESLDMVSMEVMVVKQADDPKPVRATTAPRPRPAGGSGGSQPKPPAADTTQPGKSGLDSGKGGGLLGGRRGL
ncbi:MAG: hypothetical protein FWC40_04520 [Proteobacteria bacterium]|nr:hypothetical protein [Pseudomonadota bacterium]